MDFIITLVNGLSLGGVYAMIALGYTMVYGIAKLLNFAHGDVIMVSGYAILVFLSFDPILAIICATLFCMLLGIAMERVAYRPLRGASPLAVLITAIGVSYLLQSLAQIIFGAADRYVIVADLGSITLGEVKIDVGTIITLGASLVIMMALSLFVKFTRTGRAMVAVSEDRDAARLMGININRIITITFAIGSALAALAGLFSLFRVPTIMPTYGAMPGIKAFVAAVIGGIGSIPGAMLGGILLGVVECICNSTPLAPYTIAIEFAILIVILLVKPTGILGKKRREKV
nr:branched-chain amino acid ABC transporter permease [Clostridia bacterium]